MSSRIIKTTAVCLLLIMLAAFAGAACRRGAESGEASAPAIPTCLPSECGQEDDPAAEAARTEELPAADGPTEGASTETAPTDAEPTADATDVHTDEPSSAPTLTPNAAPTAAHTDEPTDKPTDKPTEKPTAAPTSAPTSTPTAAPTQATMQQLINAKIASMTMEEKVGQLLMFGFGTGGTPDAAFLRILEQYPVGNIIFYGMNINKNDGSGGFNSVKNQIALIDSQYPAAVPRFYSADVEGGTVSRFIWDPELKSPYELGQGSADEAYAQFRRVGLKLRATGINIDLAPVMDISPDPLSTFLGTRIISSDPAKASEIGNAIIRGLHSGGCMATAKHFPGHGGTTEDSHDHTPVISKPAEEMWNYDLIPFSSVISGGVDCVMAAHIRYPAFDRSEIATTSYSIITGLLRNTMGFGGIVISDEITMGGAASQNSPGDTAVKFIRAGGDIVLCGADYSAQQQVISALYSACRNGSISTQRLDQSVYRILAYKYRYGIWTP